MASGKSVLYAAVVLAVVVACAAAADDYYKILGIERDATPRDIKKAFRKLSLEQHPDRGGDTKKYQDISRAYEVLSDPEKRRTYDQYGDENAQQGMQHGGFDPFGDFFGFRSGGGQQQRQQLPPTVVTLEATLEDLYNGRSLRVAQKRQVLCHKCRGTGAADPSDVKKCTACGGTGVRMRTVQLAPGFVQQTQATCDVCGGKGRIFKGQCPHCHGKKVEQGEDMILVTIEQGMADGTEIVYEQRGDEKPDVTPGDVKFVIKTLPHAHFTRRGNDLHIKFWVSLLEALVGFEKELKHLDGHVVKLHRTDVTKPGLVVTIAGEGMPIAGTPSVHGDLHVEFHVRFPTSLTEEQKEGFKKLLR
eukprot:m51a1_g14505 putative heat shock protein family protein (360) ;mRNA; r:805103-807122